MKSKLFLLFAVFHLLVLSACSLPLGPSPAVTPSISALTPTSANEFASPTVEIVSPTAPLSSATITQPAPTATQPAPTNTRPAPTATQKAPTAQPEVTRPPLPAGRYAVILVEEGDVLNIRSDAGVENSVVGQYAPGYDNVITTGRTASAGDDLWAQVNSPSGGAGWVNAWYLTEYVTSQEFCADPDVTTLLENFKRALNTEDGDLLAALVSPAHGLEMYYWRYGPSANYNSAEASWVFQSTYEVNWGSGASAIDDVGTFSEIPLPALLEVVNHQQYEQRCNDISTASMYVEPWPAVYARINFYALHKPGTPNVDLDWQTWLAGVEYVQGKPYLFALVRFVWEP